MVLRSSAIRKKKSASEVALAGLFERQIRSNRQNANFSRRITVRQTFLSAILGARLPKLRQKAISNLNDFPGMRWQELVLNHRQECPPHFEETGSTWPPDSAAFPR